jgi:hypothetical protein
MPKSWLVRGAESADRARRRMQLLGVTPNGHLLWEPWEVEPVIGRYPDYRSIFPVLDRRTHPAVYNKAGRLGITKPRAPAWSDNEILRLRKVYPTCSREQILAAFPRRSFAAVAKAANARGIFRDAKAPKPSGNALLDQILVRAKGRNVTLAELDAQVRQPGYFSKRKWKNSGFRFSAHAKAVEFLGGRIAIHWSDMTDRGLAK